MVVVADGDSLSRYASSFQSKARHIQIKYDGTRYGLAEPLAFYSLEDLIKYYKDTELSSTITKQLTTALNQFV